LQQLFCVGAGPISAEQLGSLDIASYKKMHKKHHSTTPHKATHAPSKHSKTPPKHSKAPTSNMADTSGAAQQPAQSGSGSEPGQIDSVTMANTAGAAAAKTASTKPSPSADSDAAAAFAAPTPEENTAIAARLKVDSSPPTSSRGTLWL